MAVWSRIMSMPVILMYAASSLSEIIWTLPPAFVNSNTPLLFTSVMWKRFNASTRQDWQADIKLCSQPVHSFIHRLFGRLLPNMWTRYIEHKWTNFDAYWHKWSAGKGHDTFNFWVRWTKVKVTRGWNRSQKYFLARYVKNSPMNFNQTWRAHITVNAIVSQQPEGRRGQGPRGPKRSRSQRAEDIFIGLAWWRYCSGSSSLFNAVFIIFTGTLLRYIWFMASAVRLSSVCLLSVMLVHFMQRFELFRNIFALFNSLGTRTFCTKIFRKNSREF